MTDITTQAAEWLVTLSAEQPSASREDRAAFERWKKADPRHALAVRKMEAVVGRLQALPVEPAAAVLNNRPGAAGTSSEYSWASLAKTCCLAIFLLLPLWQFGLQQPLSIWLADINTARGEWQTHTLSDQSRLMLSSNSAVNLDFNREQRRIELLRGEILIDVAKDAARPLIVRTPHGQFTALGTRFTLRLTENASVLSVLESRVLVEAKTEAKAEATDADKSGTSTQALQTLVLSPGQRVALDQMGIGEIQHLDSLSYEQAWRSRQLVVEGEPLAEVLAQLAPFHAAHLSYSASELSHLRVYAVLPLDDPKRALQLPERELPHRGPIFYPLVGSG